MVGNSKNNQDEAFQNILNEKEKMQNRMAELEKIKKEIGREYEDMRYKYMKLGNQNSKLREE